jgi:hypothetical protein
MEDNANPAGLVKRKVNKSFLASTPSAVLAIITTVIATLVIFGIGEGLSSFIKIKGGTGDALAYILYDIVITCCCYLIVKQNPKSIWYVPFICNVLGIIAAIIEPNFWVTPMWIPFSSGWILSIVASIIGAVKGKRTPVTVDH